MHENLAWFNVHISIFGLSVCIQQYQYFSLCGSCIACTDVVYISLLFSKMPLGQKRTV